MKQEWWNHLPANERIELMVKYFDTEICWANDIQLDKIYTQEIGVHLSHCYTGEYKDTCKYGDEKCPAQKYKIAKSYKQELLNWIETELKLSDEDSDEGESSNVYTDALYAFRDKVKSLNTK